MKIKLCGMFRKRDIEYANEAKPDFIGFVVNFPKSHRSIDPRKAAKLKALLSPDIKAVGVFVDSPISVIREMARDGVIDLVQLHGSEDADYIARLRAEVSLPIIKAVKVTSREDIDRAAKLSPDFLLLDSGTGTGKAFDHSLIDPKRIPLPYFLAGGFTPENAAEAANLGAFAVDMSSGIETGGAKDREKMLKAVKATKMIDYRLKITDHS